MLMTYGEYRRLEKLRRARQLKRLTGYVIRTIGFGLGAGVAMAVIWLVAAIL